jgi:hypothetical protein
VFINSGNTIIRRSEYNYSGNTIIRRSEYNHSGNTINIRRLEYNGISVTCSGDSVTCSGDTIISAHSVEPSSWSAAAASASSCASCCSLGSVPSESLISAGTELAWLASEKAPSECLSFQVFSKMKA